MGILAVIVAALAGFAFGAVWYMTLSKPWMAAAQVQVGPDGRPVNGSSPLPFVMSGIAMLLVAGFMRHIFAMAGIDSIGKGLLSGLGIGAFFVAPWIAMDYGYAMRPRALTLIDGGYAVFGCGIIGLVLTLF
jgi:hypothetical protein